MSDISYKNYKSLAEAFVDLYGPGISIAHTDRLTGGDINKAYKLYLSNGKTIFMKANSFENSPFFTAEAAGLTALASSGCIGIPEILCTGTDPGEQAGWSFLLLTYLDSAKQKKDYWKTFGHELAALHKAPCSSFVKDGRYGFAEDNFIGSAPQQNTPHDTWAGFYRDCRLAPQLQRASHYFDNALKEQTVKLLDHLDTFLPEPETPSLLHGDLWVGNVLCGPDGKAWILDPACYVGNREADIAMTELFGGIPEQFYAAYNEAFPLENGYEERRDLYNLYQMLNHLNLFGRSYLEPVQDIVHEYTK